MMKGLYTPKTDYEAVRAFLMNMGDYNMKATRRSLFQHPAMTKEKIRVLVKAKRVIAEYSKVVRCEMAKDSIDFIVLGTVHKRRHELVAEIEGSIFK